MEQFSMSLFIRGSAALLGGTLKQSSSTNDSPKTSNRRRQQIDFSETQVKSGSNILCALRQHSSTLDSMIFGSGVCMMSTTWKDNQHPCFIHFISSFLCSNSYRLNILPISPDFIFNNGGLSVAFVFATNWDCDNASTVFSRVEKLRRQFGHLYVVVSVPTKEQNDSFNQSYFKYCVELGSPTFVPVCDPEMGFEKIVKIAHARGVCKRQDAISMMKLERERAVQTMDLFLKVVTSIPGIDNHDANALAQAVGSIEAISKASKDFLLESTDLSVEKADRIVRFFRDPSYYLGPKIN